MIRIIRDVGLFQVIEDARKGLFKSINVYYT
jgi:hypothetical protein